MANETFTANQSTILTGDTDVDGVIDPGEIVTTTVTITNNSTTPTPVNATGVQFTEDLSGMTLVDQPGSLDNINVSPIAFDDGGYTTAGNVSFTAAVSVLGNDIEPLGPEGFALNTGTAVQNTGVALATSQGGSVTLNANGTFTYVSAVGFEGTDTFTYTLRDTGMDGVAGNADDLTSSTGTVSITVGPSVWFIDNTAPGSLNLGTQAHPFTSIAAFNAAQGTANGPDAGDVIYLREGTYTEADGINLATGQTLIGQGQNLVVNGVTIETATSAPTIVVTGAGGEGVLLAQNNTLSGFNISTTNAAADGIEDGGGTVGTLTISNVSISGTGQAVDIDQGGTLNVTIDSLSSTGSSEQGVQLAAVGTALTGTFTVTTGAISGSTGTAFQIGNGDAGAAGTGGTVAVTFGGTLANAGAVRAVEVQDRAAGAGTVTFSGNITQTAGGTASGIVLDDNVAGNVTFSGATNTFNSTTANAINITDQTGGTVTFSNAQAVNTTTGTGVNIGGTTTGSTITFGGGGAGLDIATTGGTGFSATGGGTVNVAGSSNSVGTTTGQILNWNGVSVGASNATFTTLQSTGTVANTAINLNNVDGNTFNGGTVTIAATSGAGSDGISISNGSTTAFNFTAATIDNTGDDAIDLNGANGAVTFTTVNLDGMAGAGIETTGNTNAVNINGGSIGSTNDPAGIAVDVNGGTGNVTIGATVNKTTAGDVVEVTGRSTGTVDFNGNITSTNGGGIDINTNTGGTVRFDGGMNLSTGATTAFNATGNTGATLVVTDPGAGSNILATTTGTALNVANTTIGAEDLTFQSISAGTGAGSAGVGISLDTTGSLGGLHVTGLDGADAGTNPDAGSGGTIQHKTGADGSNTAGIGIYLNNTTDVQLAGMQLNDFNNFAIKGNLVTDFRLTDSHITGVNGTNVASPFNEGSVSFIGTPTTGFGLSGNVAILDSEISGGAQRNVSIDNATGTMNLNFLRNNVHDTTDAVAPDDGFSLEADTSAVVVANISDNTFSNHKGDDFNLSLINNAVVDLTFNNNDLNGGANKLSAGVFILGATFNGSLEYDISGNNIQGANQGGAIFVNKGSGTGTFSGQIVDNVIGDPAVPLSGAQQSVGIHASARGAGGSHTTLIDGNEVYEYFDRGIVLEAGEGAPTLNATVTNNTVSDFADAINSLHGIHFDFGILGADNATIRIDVQDNLIANAGNEAQGGVDFRMRVAGNNDVFIAGYSGGNNSANAQAFIDGQNPAGTTFSVSQAAGGTYNNLAANGVPQPDLPELPAPPLLAAPGGVEAAAPADTIPPANTASPADTTPPVDAPPPAADNLLPQETAGAPGAGDPPPATPPVSTTHPVIVDDGVLTEAELDYFVDAAIARWSEAGLTEAQLDALEAMSFGVADMAGLNLGAFAPTQITLDADAAGRGWYLDGTPLDDAEFGTVFSATWMQTTPTGAPAGHYDLLTTIMHEMGHALGVGDTYDAGDRGDLMYGWLYTGERRLPGADDADGAVAGSITSEEFLGAPIDIGVLPAGKTVTIQWQATIDPQTNGLIVNPVNTGTVSATNAVGFPDTNTNTVTTTLDTLTLGGTIWNDNGAGGGVAGNGVKDGTEAGIAGVTLSLFVDANNDNVPDNLGAPLVTGVLTNGSGDYSFTGLAPGNYIVRVDQDNFNAGGNTSLVATPVSPVTIPEPPDPDDGDPDTNNDDNGSRVEGQAAFSKAITLAYNQEPTAGTGNDTNNTLDFGFFSNPPPVITNLDGDTATFTEGLTPVILDDSSAPELAATVTDNQANLNGGSLTVKISDLTEVAGEDVLGISTAGTVTLSNGTNLGSTVAVGGLNVGTVTSDGNGGDDLVITFNTTNATPANVTTLLRALSYANTNTLNPSTTARSLTVTVNDGLAGVAVADLLVNVVGVNDEPTLTATADNPTFTEGNALPADLFDSAVASTVEAGQTFTSMTLTITNVTDGVNEILEFDGTDFSLVDGNNILVTPGNNLNVTVSVVGTTATVSFSGASLSAAQLQTLIDELGFASMSQDPTDADRVVTITQLVDSGSNVAPNDNTTALNIASTVNIDPVNNAANITGDAAGDVTEAGGVNNGTAGQATDTGDLNSTDVDNPDDTWQAVAAGTASVGGFGTYAVTAAGTWTYTLDDTDPAVQALNGIATLQDTFNVFTEDGTSQTVTVTIHAQNDVPTITGDAAGDVTEAGGVNNGTPGTPTATGNVDSDDVDNPDDTWQAVAPGTASIGGFGTYAVTANGTWTYTLDDTDPVVQALNGVATLQDTFNVVTLDGTSQTVTVTINAQNDAATIIGDAAGDVIEAGGANNGSPGTPTDTGDLNSDDVDNPDDTWQAIAAGTAGDNGFGTFEMTATGVWSYTLDNNDPAVQALNGLATLTDTLTVQTVDGTAQVITVTILAQNDTPTVTGDITGNVVEAGGVNNGTPGTPTATGNVDSDDVDNPDDTWQAVAAGTATLGGFGTYAVTTDGTWTYTLDDTDPAVQALNGAATLQDTFNVVTLDGTSQTVTVTIAAQNDAATIIGDAAGDVIEAGGVNNGSPGTPTDTGDLNSDDVDNPDDTWQAVAAGTAGDNGFGTFEMTATGVWSYTLDNNDPAVQALNGLDTLTDTLTVQTVDGTAQVITVTILAQNDTPTVTGDITGNVVEAGGVNNGTPGTPTATGNVDSDDVDNPDDTWQAVAAGTATLGGFGTYAVTTDGTWTYTLDDTDPAVQALNGAATLQDTFNVVTLDGTSQTVTVTIAAQNDAATITGDAAGDVIEAGGVNNGSPGTPTDTGDLNSDDVDNPDDTWQAIAAGTAGDNGFGTFEMTATGVWSYTLDNNDPAVQALNGLDTLTDTLTVQTVDGTAQVITVTILAQNDTPTVTGDITGNVVEAGGVNNGTPGTPTATGNVDSDDVDNPDDTWQAVAAGTATLGGFGTYAVTTDGTWTYTLDDTDPAVQALNGAATLQDTFNVVTLDGTSQTVTVTIAAQNDAATITGDAAGDVIEAGGVNNGSPGTPTDTGDLNSDDVDNPDDTWQAVAAGTAGDNGFGTFEMTATGVWSYTLDNNDPAVQALNGLATLTDTLTVQTVDGTAQVITVTILAQNDTPTVTGDITGNVVEAGGVNNGTPGTPTATGNVDSDDVDNPDDTWQAVAAGTATLGGFGTYAVTTDGTWTYTLDDTDPAVQALNGAATLQDTFNVVTLDGTSQTVTVTIAAQNDAATIIGDAAGDVIEAGGVNNGSPGTPTDTGDLNSDDVDNPDDTWQAVAAGTAGDNGFGTFEMTATGVWSYTLDNNDPAVQALNGLATLTDTLTVQTVDGTAQVITVTILAQNDTPTVTGDITGNVVEAGGVNNGTPGTPTATGNVDSDDVDNPDDTWQAVAAGTASLGGFGTYAVTTDGTWTYTLDDTDPAVQALNGAATLQDTFNVVTLDGTSQTVTITIAAQNDAATINGTSSGAVTEAGGVANGTVNTPTATGDLLSTDPDNTNDAWQPVAAGALTSNGFGTYELSAAGVWTYTLDNTNTTVQSRNVGDIPLTDSFTVLTEDGTQQVVNISINPANDAANVIGDITGDVTEAGGVNNGTPGTPTDTGNLDSTDVDNANDSWQAVAAGGATANGFGTYQLTAAGVWTYTLDDDNVQVQALNGVNTLTDTFNAVTSDGTQQLVSITIHAQNDSPSIAGDAAGDVTEAGGINNGTPGTATDTGDLDYIDVDNDPDDAWNAVAAGTAGDNGFGTFEMTAAGVWTYTLDDTDPTVQALNGANTLTDTITVSTSDGKDQQISVTIHAQNDTPAITGTATGSVTEAGGVNNGTPGTPTATGNVDSDDVDNPDDTWQAVAPGTASIGGFGTYALTADGNWTYTVDDNDPDVQALNGAATLQDTFNVVTLDGTSQTVTITIAAQNDAATINGTSSGAVTEAGGVANGTVNTPTATGDLLSTDPDNTNDAWQPVAAGALTSNGFGTYELSAAGVWTYTLDNTNTTVQSRNVGDIPLTDSFTVLTEDGTQQVVNISINPANDAANVIGDITGDVTEAGGVNNGTPGTPTDTGNLDSTDVDNANDSWQAVAAGGATANGFGTYQLTAAGVWTYTLDDDNVQVQALNGVNTLTDTFNAVTSDGTQQLVSITIHAQNDSPSIAGDAAGDVTEAGGINNGTPGTATDTGDLDYIDVDNDPDDAWNAVAAGTAGDNGFGTFEMTAAGVWTYTLDDTDPTVQALNGANTLTDTITVSTSDGKDQQISVTIHAQNDTPAITGTATGSVTEAGGVNNGTPGTPTATGNVDSDDVDNPDDTWQAVAAGTASIGGFGTYAVTANGTWTYTLDDTDPAVQALNGVATLQDTFNVVTLDGTSQTVTITIAAQNDAPTFGSGDTFSVAELGIGGSVDGTVVGIVTAQDPDDNAGFTFALVNDAGGRFAINATTGQLTVAKSSLLDFEQNQVHAIIVQVTDSGGLSTNQTVTINVTDHDPENGIGDGDNNTILAGGGDDFLRGAGGSDTLSTDGGNDRLDGGVGADTMAGGSGNDIYFVDNANDAIIEGAGEGVLDRLFASVSYGLAAGVGIELMATANSLATTSIALTGNALANTIYGNAGANVLTGGGGNDLLLGLAGDDNLNGGTGDDRLYGGIGQNDMAGGLGNDWYIVDSLTDVIIEAAGQGTLDRVFTTLNYTLSAGVHVEIMAPTTTHIAAINLTGNELANTIAGNNNVNVLRGAAGNDLLLGRGGTDTLHGGANADVLYGGNDNDTLHGGDGNDRLLGGAGADTVNGGAGNDLLRGEAGDDNLNGGLGNDRLEGGAGQNDMAGGLGNDTYIVTRATDTVTDAGVQGSLDRVYTSVNFALAAAAQIEFLATNSLAGTGAINLTGNGFANAIYGNNGANVISGKGGKDTLSGRGGPDIFVFDTAPNTNLNRDTITDFNGVQDNIRLVKSAFAALTGAAGTTLSADQFVVGAAALDANDHIIYNNGTLNYDSNGNLAGGVQVIAFLVGKPALSNTDIVLG